MLGRIFIAIVALGVGLLGPAGVAIADGAATGRTRQTEAAMPREDDDGGVLTVGGEEDDDDSDSFTSGIDSNDATNSRVTGVSRDLDRSRGDLTRDRTKDGPGAATRDRTAGSTNDRSRHDTR